MDANLKLLAIESLVTFVEDEEIIRKVNIIDRDHSLESENEEIRESVKAEYLNIELSESQLASIKILSGECADVHFAIQPSWSGEGEYFNPQTLDGIELMKNLECIEFVDLSRVNDFSPLLCLNLKEISSCLLPPKIIEKLKINNCTVG
jgi:hypothetical protein